MTTLTVPTATRHDLENDDFGDDHHWSLYATPWEFPGYSFPVEHVRMPPLSTQEESISKIDTRFVTNVHTFHGPWFECNPNFVCDRCERQLATFTRFGFCGCVNGGGDLNVRFCKGCYDLYCDLEKETRNHLSQKK